MRLSMLDQSPLLNGASYQEAFEQSVKLAQLGESFGYTRFWLTEHHDLPNLASSAPEILLGYIGSKTNQIRLGTGAVLLPHYKPYKVLEVHHTLATLFPNRIDLGVGRAPGGTAEATMALSDNFLANVGNFPQLFNELLAFLNQSFSDEHMFSKLAAAPVPAIKPSLWLLGTSEKSAKLAAEKGVAYVFGQFMSDNNGKDIVQNYKRNFQASQMLDEPLAIITTNVICAETSHEAERILKKVLSLKKENKQGFDSDSNVEKKIIVGNPTKVKQELIKLASEYEVDEIMINTMTFTYQERLDSYRLIAKEMLL